MFRVRELTKTNGILHMDSFAEGERRGGRLSCSQLVIDGEVTGARFFREKLSGAPVEASQQPSDRRGDQVTRLKLLGESRAAGE